MNTPALDAEVFRALLQQVLAEAERFSHRQHVQLTWLAVTRYGRAAALQLVDTGIRDTARAAGAPEKYHATMTRVWVELVAHHAEGRADTAFEDFVRAAPDLLDKQLLSRFYSPDALAAPSARAGWVPPDMAPLP
jgi:hypothetical protein